MPRHAAELAQRLARNAEAVCRHYLSNGRREGRYWLVGDVRNTPGRSLFVRLKGPDSGKGAAGKWTDSATAEHGDLLDLIRETCCLADFHDVADEARRFLSLPMPSAGQEPVGKPPTAPAGSPESARRLFAMSQPILGTLAETYLRKRGITALHGTANLRFHPRCYYRADRDSSTETWPAMIAAVSDCNGAVSGVHRTWLDPTRHDKAPVDTPRRAMGNLLGNAVRFGVAHDVMAAGEGIETMLSLRCVMPAMPMVAALSAAHLAAILFSGALRRLYVARDNDPAGNAAVANLINRSVSAGIEAIILSPRLADFNEDIRTLGVDALRAAIRAQIVPEDVARFMELEMSAGTAGELCATPVSCRVRSRGDASQFVGEDRAHGLLSGRSGGKRTGRAMADRRLFSVGGPSEEGPPLHREAKIAGIRHPPLRFVPPLRSGCKSGPAAAFRRHEGRDGRGRSDEGQHPMTTERDDTSFEPPHASSPTEHVLAELQLYGYRPFQDDPDPRPLPEARIVEGAVADIFDALVVALSDTRLEPDLEELLWSTVNLFHRASSRIERELDDNEQAQKRSQRDQDGSEIRSVELERLTGEGQTLIERRNCMEFFRDQAADQFEHHTGSAWRPRSGSMVNHRTLTSAMIDSRDFIAAKRRAETEVLVPPGPKIAVTGGLDFNDHRLIWDKLDRVHAKHPDMVLLHGGSPKGAERIAARWADHRKVPQIAFKPDWTKHAKAAPFKRNDQILEVLPIGIMVFPGTGIQDNLADKARKLGIPVWKFGGGA